MTTVKRAVIVKRSGPPTRPKRAVKESDRARVVARAVCEYCRCQTGPFEVDHRRPVSRAGSNDFENLELACVSCNTQKSNFLLHEWIQWRKANGMSWPPVARHATDLRHYKDRCPGARGGEPGPECEVQATVPNELRFDGKSGYKVFYLCTCGRSWTCWHALSVWYFTDCPCDWCVAARLEESS